MMEGRTLAARIRARVADDVREVGGVGLATILVGEDAASEIYIGRKHEAAREAGIRAVDVRLSAETSEAELLALVAELNVDATVDALLVQLPLPADIDEERVARAIDPRKDVDGLHPENVGELVLGRPRLVPATAVGIVALLVEYGIHLAGARAVVVGRSAIVGKPTAHLLLQANATVTICHSRTQDLARHTLDADVLVAAVGRTHLISADMVKAGATVIDVGMNRDESSRKVLGDVDPGAMEPAAYMTPVPGGVGPMTIAMVLQNAITAARLRRAVPVATPKN